eukprot:CAMPEP_0170535812 /NCGR_PEP_ID=MMETSP0209-20121228/101801_1 /TAXON_ID=665100 ORGANISM="Litonotus pictus, Strain P1" /NCGR_SAMPLE_ID=MMETSP0209 /ASSEMBLY_ACC=CAM_ASM_000301 /LENGTH=601 /DNA_ID=CAMNT_0010837111 /DNA_START=78 /DNA_END=1884 /DNA_ORIENTATION=-
MNKVNSKHSDFTPASMTRERSRTKEILNKFQPKPKENNNRSLAKSEVYADKKGQQKLLEIKEAQAKKKELIEQKKQEELNNFPTRVMVQFSSAEGKNLGGTMSIETSFNKLLINSVVNKLKNDGSTDSHLLLIEDTEISNSLKQALLNCYNQDKQKKFNSDQDTEISNSLKQALLNCYNQDKQKKFNSESVVKIVYHPENLYSVKPLTRGGESMEGHTDSILTCMFSPCGKYLASGGGDSIIRVWDMETFTLMHNIEGHQSWIMNVAWSPCGRYLTTGSLNGRIIVVDGKKGEIDNLPIFAHKDCVTSLSWKPLHLTEEPTFVSSGKDGNIRCYNVKQHNTIFNIGGHNEAISKVIWSGENIIYSCSRDKLLKSWSDIGELLKVYSGHGHWINTMSINTEFILRTGFYDYESRNESSGYNKNSFLEEKSGKEQKEAALERYNKIKSTFNFKSIDRIVTGSDDYSMILWNPQESTKPVNRLTGHNQLVNHVMFSPNTMFIASGSFDKSVKLWNGHTGAFICNFFGHIAAIYQISWSADSKFILSSSKDSTVKLWNCKSDKNTKACRHNLPGHADEVYCIDWSPDGLAAASGSKDRRVNIWKH